MYEQYFALKSRPFRAVATGPDVFVGPQTAKTMAGLKKALDVSDAVVTVTGQVGVGKTTLVHRALSAVESSRVIISVGRMQLEHDEVLELLLDELGTRQTPAGTVQRFSLFRRLLKGFADQGKRVFIVVEDASRIGIDALVELEALTAADSGVSDGANIILMGEPGIKQLLNTPKLARLKQRIRFRETISTLSSGEMLAYLKHSFRLAGGEFDAIFDNGTAELLHQHSGGIPRVVNNTVETILGSAAEQKLDRISPQFITSVVADECGMTVQLQTLDPSAGVIQQPAVDVPTDDDGTSSAYPLKEESSAAIVPSEPEEEPAVAIDVSARTIAEAEAEAEADADADAESESELESSNDEDDDDSSAEEDDDQIPELIQDTLPNLSILAPELAAMPTPVEAKAEPDPVPSAVTSQRSTTTIKPEAIEAESNHPSSIEPSAIEPSQIEPSQIEIDSDIPELIFEDKPSEEPVTAHVDDGIPILSSSIQLEHPISESSVNDSPVTETKPEIKPEPAKPVAAKSTPVEEKPVEIAPVSNAAPPVVDDAVSQADLPANSGEVPAWELDPTLAELRPDLDALERAMSYTLGSDGNSDGQNDVEEPIAEKKDQPVPEITLDRAIQEKIDEAAELLKKTTIDLAEMAAAEEAKVAEKSAAESKPNPSTTKTEVEQPSTETQAELQKISTEIAKAKTIDDVDEQFAETLFGEEFSKIAAQVAAHAAANPSMPEESANDDLQIDANQTDATTSVAESSPSAATKPVVKPAPIETEDNMSATQRLRTVRALNGNYDPVPEPSESIVLSADTAISMPPSSGKQPELIEDQINTSMTQTLKALNVRPPPAINDDDDDFDQHDDDDEKGGFFSRFRRS
jgi:general secretion pathway protein A